MTPVQKRWLTITCVTILGACLRLPFLGQQSLWFDETYTLNILQTESFKAFWQLIEKTESTPPLYYLVSWVIHADTVVGMRAVSALSLIAAIPCSYLAFRKLIGENAALATSAFLAVNPFLVNYSTNGRSYGLFVLTALLSIWGFAGLVERKEQENRIDSASILWVAGSILCIWTHYFGVFLIFGEIVALITLHKDRWRMVTRRTFLICLGVTPLIPMILHQSADERAGFIAQIPLWTRLTQALRQLFAGANVPYAWLETITLLTIAISVGIVTLEVAKKSRFLTHTQQALLLMLLAVVGGPLLLSLIGVNDRFYVRNLIVSIPLLGALLAPAMVRFRCVLLTAYVAFSLVSAVWVLADWRYQQADWQQALQTLQTEGEPEFLFAIPQLDSPVVATYLKGKYRQPSTALQTKTVLVMTTPSRPAGSRAFRAGKTPTIPGFQPQKIVQTHGFQIVYFTAQNPVQINSLTVPNAVLFQRIQSK